MSPLRALFTLGIASVIFISCTGVPIYTLGDCEKSSDCGGFNSQAAGSICNLGKCMCPPGTVPCCPKALPGECVAACSPEHACDRDDAGVDAASDGATACEEDSDCPQPPSSECGQGSCVEGQCALEIHPGPLPSQRYGDCKRRDCDIGGTLIEVDDPSDYYNDANVCTTDSCKDGSPSNMQVGNGTTCPESGLGYCYEARCVECIAVMPGATCGGGLACDAFWCVPFPQCSGDCGGLCAPCASGHPCQTDADCQSQNCGGGMCQLPSCNNGKKDGKETGVDCGSDTCGPCPAGQGCKLPNDCSSGVCKFGKCEPPTCFDGTLNGDETGVDCGGACGPC